MRPPKDWNARFHRYLLDQEWITIYSKERTVCACGKTYNQRGHYTAAEHHVLETHYPEISPTARGVDDKEGGT